MSFSSFDLGKKTAIVLFSIIISGFVFGTLISIDFFQKTWQFQDQTVLEDCESYGHIAEWNYCGDYFKYYNNINTTESYFDDLYDKNIVSISKQVFNDYRVLPFLSSLFFIIITYLVTEKITGKKYAGLLSMILLAQSPIFYKYTASALYPSFWGTLFMLSLYATLYKQPTSLFAYLVSIVSKPLTLFYSPILLLFMNGSTIRRKKPLMITTSIITICLFVVATQFIEFGFHPEEALNILMSWPALFASDIPMFLLLFTSFLGLIILYKDKTARVLLLSLVTLIAQLIIIETVLPIRTDNEEYRLIVFVAFIAMSVSYLVTQLPQLLEKVRKKKTLKHSIKEDIQP